MMKILTGADNKTLRQKSKTVEKFDKSLAKLIKTIKELMIKEKGVGLAAIQVGEPLRLTVIRLNHGTPKEAVIALINPEIIEHSRETEIAEEGCLSVPNQFGHVERAKEIKVQFCDEKGGSLVLKLDGFHARIVQHEIDHMEGILFVDRLVAGKTEIL